MKLRNPALIRAVGVFIAYVARLWMGTVRCRFPGPGRIYEPAKCLGAAKYIYAFWHEGLFFGVNQASQRNLCILVSQHADGELLTQVYTRLGYEVVRGSTSRGGVDALRKLMRSSQEFHIAVTPDGPRGPRRKVQPGVVYLASRTGLPLIPTGIAFHNAWRAGSWDRMAVPRPFSSANCVFGEPLHIPPRLTREQLEDYCRILEARIEDVTASAEELARGCVRAA